MRDNPNQEGRPPFVPREAEGKRIHGILRNGDKFGLKQIGPTTPKGWAADGRHGCRWSKMGLSHDIMQFEVY